jgi:hypothetical protein
MEQIIGYIVSGLAGAGLWQFVVKRIDIWLNDRRVDKEKSDGVAISERADDRSILKEQIVDLTRRMDEMFRLREEERRLREEDQRAFSSYKEQSLIKMSEMQSEITGLKIIRDNCAGLEAENEELIKRIADLEKRFLLK